MEYWRKELISGLRKAEDIADEGQLQARIFELKAADCTLAELLKEWDKLLEILTDSEDY